MTLEEFLKKIYDRGEDPYKLTGKRDDTMDMVLALLQSQEEPVDWGGMQDVAEQAPPGPQGPPPPEQNSWAAFQAMNPNLDYAKVAQQAGGKMGSFPADNKYGGAISDNSQNAPLPKGQREEDLIAFVNNQIPIMEAERKLDPRSRAYDPKGAELLMQMADKNRARDAYQQALDLEKQQMIESKRVTTGDIIDNLMGMISKTSDLALQNSGIQQKLMIAKAADMRGDSATANAMLNEVQDMLNGGQSAVVDRARKSPDASATLKFSRDRGVH